MSNKLDQLREQGLKYQGFREGYQARDGRVRLGILLLVVIGLIGIALSFLLKLISLSIE
jgi:hypothetical protein